MTHSHLSWSRLYRRLHLFSVGMWVECLNRLFELSESLLKTPEKWLLKMTQNYWKLHVWLLKAIFGGWQVCYRCQFLIELGDVNFTFDHRPHITSMLHFHDILFHLSSPVSNRIWCDSLQLQWACEVDRVLKFCMFMRHFTPSRRVKLGITAEKFNPADKLDVMSIILRISWAIWYDCAD